MNKLTAIRIKLNDNEYSDEIPISVNANNVKWNESYNLKDNILGEIDPTQRGSVATQLSTLFSQKVSSEDFSDYQEELETDINNFKTEINNKIGTPLVASTASAMSNTTKIYVYVGNESGYTNGNWYYYDNAQDLWVSGGVYNSTAFETDDTLTVEGAAADAKKTGDTISALNTELNALGFSVVDGALNVTYTEE